MKKKVMLLTLFLVLLCACMPAQAEEKAVPEEVQAYICTVYQEPEVEDYLALPSLPDGDYGFALVRSQGIRALMGFRWKDGQMENWLDSMGAVPQTDRKAALYNRKAGTQISYFWDSDDAHQYVSDGYNIGVSVPNEWYEATESEVYYEWMDGSFVLKQYRNHFYDVDIIGDTLYFWDIGGGLRNVIDTDVRQVQDILDVEFEKLPRRAGDISQRADDPPEIPHSYEEHALYAETYEFVPGCKYPVYNGPGTQYQRAGNGKASVSTNEWIQVFGEYDGWLMIQYAIDETRCRIGWITRDALPEDRHVDQLVFALEERYTLSDPGVLTDDPLCSHTALCSVPTDVFVEGAARLGDGWMYVRVTLNGIIWWGFLPTDILGNG